MAKKRDRAFRYYCHFPGCCTEVSPRLWGCAVHWRMLPTTLKIKILATYRPGQEHDKDPSREYVIVAQQVQDWCVKEGRMFGK